MVVKGFFGGGVELGLELRDFRLQSRCSAAWATPSVQFALVILEMWFPKLFNWAGLKPWSCCSQLLK
jgi:hypothetical protein